MVECSLSDSRCLSGNKAVRNIMGMLSIIRHRHTVDQKQGGVLSVTASIMSLHPTGLPLVL